MQVINYNQVSKVTAWNKSKWTFEKLGELSSDFRSMEIVNSISTMGPTLASLAGTFDRAKISMPKGGKIELYLEDDVTDDLYLLQAFVDFRCEPAVVNG